MCWRTSMVKALHKIKCGRRINGARIPALILRLPSRQRVFEVVLVKTKGDDLAYAKPAKAR